MEALWAWKILGANIRSWANFPWFFKKNDSPKFDNIKLFYVKNRQHYIKNIYTIIINALILQINQ